MGLRQAKGYKQPRSMDATSQDLKLILDYDMQRLIGLVYLGPSIIYVKPKLKVINYTFAAIFKF